MDSASELVLEQIAFSFVVCKVLQIKQQVRKYNLIYIHIYTLLVSLYPINVKTAEPIGPKFCLGPQRRFMEDRIFYHKIRL